MCFPITLIERKKIFIQQTVFFGNWKKNSICWPARPVSHSECFAQLEMVFFVFSVQRQWFVKLKYFQEK